MPRKITFVMFILILALGAFFRFYQITEIPPGLYPDEAMNGNNALEALATGHFKVFYPENNGREGLFINLQAIALLAFGNEPWALRVVSAIFGTLTILGIYLLTKELFPKNPNIKIQISKEAPNPNDPKRLRTLDFIGNLDLGFGIYEVVPILAAFFTATSYWHINFSRIGFRAILVPFFATFGMYFLLRGLRRLNIWEMVCAGLFIGLGFHTYITSRFVPFVIAVPIGWYLWQWRSTKHEARSTNYGNDQEKNRTSHFVIRNSNSCFPCLIVLFLFITFVITLPIGYYFLQNPQDFLGRGGQVSIFSSDSPLKEFIKSNLLTIGMPFVWGDCNWRHNYACRPELNPIVSAFFVIGLITSISLLRNPNIKTQISKEAPNPNDPKRLSNWDFIGNLKFRFWILFAWLFFMSLPATLTREGLPHALRSIGMIPPVMILAGLGAYIFLNKILGWFELQKEKWPEKLGQLTRVQQEIKVLFLLMLLVIPVMTYRDYFIRWAYDPNTYFAFSTDLWHLGNFLDRLPNETKKYVITNLPGVDVRGIPMPAQTVMFATDTFLEQKRVPKHTYYVRPDFVPSLAWDKGTKVVITFLNSSDRLLINALRQKFPELKIKTPGDFIILQN